MDEIEEFTTLEVELGILKVSVFQDDEQPNRLGIYAWMGKSHCKTAWFNLDELVGLEDNWLEKQVESATSRLYDKILEDGADILRKQIKDVVKLINQ